MKNCPKCGTVVKDWDLVCPQCGSTLFNPQAPVDSRKVNVDLPNWEMKPVAPAPERRDPPPRPGRMVGAPAVQGAQAPLAPRPDPVQQIPQGPGFVDHSAEPTDMISIDEIEAVERPAPRPDPAQQIPQGPGFVDHSAEPTDMISIDEIEAVERPAPAQPAQPQVPAQPVQPPAPQQAPVVRAAPPSGRASGRARRRQDTMPVGTGTTETTQPRAKHPQSPDQQTQPRPQASSQPLQQGTPAQTLNVEDYDPERLKRILAQAQAEAAQRSHQDPNTTVYIVIGAILATTILAAAVVIALFI